jgi:integrase
MLVKIADARQVRKKTYNNIVSVLRRAFEHGYRDHPERHNPARGLKTLRNRKKDRPPVDPFSIDDAEALIAAIHQDWGEAQSNYDSSASSRDCARPSRSRSWCPTAISSEELLQSRRRA